jgi:hypothetical protein
VLGKTAEPAASETDEGSRSGWGMPQPTMNFEQSKFGLARTMQKVTTYEHGVAEQSRAAAKEKTIITAKYAKYAKTKILDWEVASLVVNRV